MFIIAIIYNNSVLSMHSPPPPLNRGQDHGEGQSRWHWEGGAPRDRQVAAVAFADAAVLQRVLPARDEHEGIAGVFERRAAPHYLFMI